MAGTVIYEAHPTMFRAHPFWFIGCIILIPGVRPRRPSAALLVHPHAADCAYLTDSELLYERGILSKDRTSVSLKHVRAVHVTQGFLNRILGVGTIQISTSCRAATPSSASCLHHRRVSDFLRGLLADDRLDLLGRAYSEGPSVWACGRVDGAAAFCCAGRPTSC
jgi:Bacterial PH domain